MTFISEQVPKSPQYLKFTTRHALSNIYKHIFIQTVIYIFFFPLGSIFSLYTYNIRQNKCKAQQEKLYHTKFIAIVKNCFMNIFIHYKS